MDFAKYYVINEVSITSNRDVRSLATSSNRNEWPDKVKEVVRTAISSNIKKEIVFIITDKSGKFAMNLIYSPDNTFNYAVRELSFPWLEENGVTSDEGNKGFYFDLDTKEFVYKVNENEVVLEKEFDGNDIDIFFDKLDYINNLCEARRQFTIFSKLYYVDKFSEEEVNRIKKNGATPRWFIYSLKSDDFRKPTRGFFSNIFQ